MKKIKSKLIYINPSYKPSFEAGKSQLIQEKTQLLGQEPYLLHQNSQVINKRPKCQSKIQSCLEQSLFRCQKSPSPDCKRAFKIFKTQSPAKQVQQYYKVKEKLANIHYKTQSKNEDKHFHICVSKEKKSLQPIYFNNVSTDFESISENIKLKSPVDQNISLSRQQKSLNYQNMNYSSLGFKNCHSHRDEKSSFHETAHKIPKQKHEASHYQHQMAQFSPKLNDYPSNRHHQITQFSAQDQYQSQIMHTNQKHYQAYKSNFFTPSKQQSMSHKEQISSYKDKSLSSLALKNTAKISRNVPEFDLKDSERYFLTDIKLKGKTEDSSKKRSKKKLEIYSPSPEKLSAKKIDAHLHQNQSLNRNSQKCPSQSIADQQPSSRHLFFCQQKAEESLNHSQNYDSANKDQSESAFQRGNSLIFDRKNLQFQNIQQERTVSCLKAQLRDKDEQIQRMTAYVKEYEKLGQKNKKMEKQMEKILRKLIQMKQKEKLLKKQTPFEPSTFHRANFQQKLEQNLFQNSFQSQQKEMLNQHQQSYVTEQQQHFQTLDSSLMFQSIHKSKLAIYLTDDYIKIYDDIDSSCSQALSQHEEQTYKPNHIHNGSSFQTGYGGSYGLMEGNNKKNSINRANYPNRNAMSVGARLKQSLMSKNQDFRASFDQSRLLSSSSLMSETIQNNQRQSEYNEHCMERVKLQTQSQAAIFNLDSKNLQTLQTEQEALQSAAQQSKQHAFRASTKLYGRQGIFQNDELSQQDVDLYPQQGSYIVNVNNNEHSHAKQTSRQFSQNLIGNQSPNNKDKQLSFEGQMSSQKQISTLKKPLGGKAKYVIKRKKHDQHQNLNIQQPDNRDVQTQESKYQYSDTQKSDTRHPDGQRRNSQHLDNINYQLSHKNVDVLIETNKRLTHIVIGLAHNNQNLTQQIRLMNQQRQGHMQTIIDWKAQTGELQLKISDLNKTTQEIISNIQGTHTLNRDLNNSLKSIEQKVNNLHKSINQNARKVKKQDSHKKIWLQNSHFSNSVPSLTKIGSFGLNDKQILMPNHKKSRKQSGSQYRHDYKEPASPSFTYLEDSGSFLTQSFKLSHSDRSNRSNSKFNYNATLQEAIMGVNSQKRAPYYSSLADRQKYQFSADNRKLLTGNRHDNSQNILIRDNAENSQKESIQSSQDLMSHSSNGTSQFQMVQMNQQSENDNFMVQSKQDKLRSSNSEIRINFDDLYEDINSHRQNPKIARPQDVNDSIGQGNSYRGRLYDQSIVQINGEESISLMKSSFGPIIMQKQMSKSEKGDSIIGESRDRIDQSSIFINMNNQIGGRTGNRPRENSSINIFFSSDSVCKSQKGEVKVNLYSSTDKNQRSDGLYPQAELQTPIQQTSGQYLPISQAHQSKLFSSACQQCHVRLESQQILRNQASQMRSIIGELTDERDGLKKLVKSKIEVIDRLEISLQQLQSFTSFEAIKSKNQIEAPFHKMKDNDSNYQQYSSDLYKNQSTESKAEDPSYGSYKSVNQFQHVVINGKKDAKTKPFPSLSSQQNIKCQIKQIKDVLPLTAMLLRQYPQNKRIQSLKCIQLEIQEELLLRREQQERQVGGEEFSQVSLQGKPFEWGKGSFSKVQQLREQSFNKTKAILMRLIHIIREFVDENNSSQIN